MSNANYYAYAPYTAQPLTYHKGKVKRIKRVKRNEVPEFYRKKNPFKSLFGFHA